MAETRNINVFKGLNTDDDELLMEDGQTSDAENVVTDEGVGLTGRKGFVDFSTEPSNNFWVLNHSNGNSYLISQSSGNIKALSSGNSFDISVGTVDNTVETVGAVLGDLFFLF